MREQKRIGLYGGTFDPIHGGHLQLAAHAFRHLELDHLFLIPAAVPPHKVKGTAFQHRFAMAELALQSLTISASVSDIEARREGPSYTLETLKYFAQHYPEAERWWLLGEDALQSIHTWYQVKDFHQWTRLAVFPRPNYDEQKSSAVKTKLPELFKVIDRVPGSTLNVSSTTLRKQLKSHPKQCPKSLPEEVYAYILAHQLYT